MDLKANNAKSKSSSILKPPKQRQPLSEVHYDSSFEVTTIGNRRVSFAEKKHVKEFCDSLEPGTVWDYTYEESDLSSIHNAVASHSNITSNDNVGEGNLENAQNMSIEIASDNASSKNSLQNNQQCNVTQYFHDTSLEMTECALHSVQPQMCNKTILFQDVSMEMTNAFKSVEADNIEIPDVSMEITEAVLYPLSHMNKHSNSNKTMVYHDESMEMTCALNCSLSSKAEQHVDDNDEAIEFTVPIATCPLKTSAERVNYIDKENDIHEQTRIFHESMTLTALVPVHIKPELDVQNVGNKVCTEHVNDNGTTIFQNESMTLTNIIPLQDSDWKHIDKENDQCMANMTNVYMNESMTFTQLVQPHTLPKSKHDGSIKVSTEDLTKVFHNESMMLTNVLPSKMVFKDPDDIHCIPELEKAAPVLEGNEDNNMSMELISTIPDMHFVSNEETLTDVDKEPINQCDSQNQSDVEGSLKKETMDDDEQHFIRKSLTFFNDSAVELLSIQPPSFICTDSMMKDSYCEDAEILPKSVNSDDSKNMPSVQQETAVESIEILTRVSKQEQICTAELNTCQDTQSSKELLLENYLHKVSIINENADVAMSQEEGSEQSYTEVQDLLSINNLDPYSQLIEKIKNHAKRDDCIWNVYAEDVDKKMIAVSFISNSLVVGLFFDDTVKEIRIISLLLDDNDDCVKMVHRIIVEKLDVQEMKDAYGFYQDVLPLLKYISGEVILALDFMFDLKRLNDLNLMEITETRVSFVSKTTRLKIILKVTVDIKPFDRISTNDIVICVLSGTVREKDVRDLFTSIKRDHSFLRRYMIDVQTYIDLMEETNYASNRRT